MIHCQPLEFNRIEVKGYTENTDKLLLEHTQRCYTIRAHIIGFAGRKQLPLDKRIRFTSPHDTLW